MMSNSSLAKSYIPAASTNHWGSRKEKIKKIIVHHMAATWTAKRCAESFTVPARKASATYCIGYDGEIVRGLDENITPGSSNGYEADKDAVTIEVSNSKMGDPWAVSDKALNSLIALCADIAKRNNLGKLVKGQNLCWHSMYVATICPGAYLLSKMSFIADEANKINYPPKAVKEVKIDGINITRYTNYLVLYVGKVSTGTNKWGTEVAVNSKGVVTCAPVKGVGNMAIPKDGYVISGHGKASTWLLENIKKGDKIKLNLAK